MTNNKQQAQQSVPNPSPEFQTEGIFGSSRELYV